MVHLCEFIGTHPGSKIEQRSTMGDISFKVVGREALAVKVCMLKGRRKFLESFAYSPDEVMKLKAARTVNEMPLRSAGRSGEEAHVRLMDTSLAQRNLDEVMAFVKAVGALSEIVWGWDPGRFVDWRWGSNLCKTGDEPEWFSNNCQVFHDGDRIAAVAISEYGGKDAAVLTAERNPDLVGEVIDWLVSNWAQPRGGLNFDAPANEYWLCALLESRGFMAGEETGHEWEYDLTRVPAQLALPQGYAFESLADRANDAVRGIAVAIHAAFHSSRSPAQIEKILDSLTANPMFRPELSVYARSPEGEVAAYCRGTVNPENGIAGIDPVCCHPDHVRKGLAKAVVQECFRRQAALGGRLAYIGSALMPAPSTCLYRSLGPRRYTTGTAWTLTA